MGELGTLTKSLVADMTAPSVPRPPPNSPSTVGVGGGSMPGPGGGMVHSLNPVPVISTRFLPPVCPDGGVTAEMVGTAIVLSELYTLPSVSFMLREILWARRFLTAAGLLPIFSITGPMYGLAGILITITPRASCPLPERPALLRPLLLDITIIRNFRILGVTRTPTVPPYSCRAATLTTGRESFLLRAVRSTPTKYRPEPAFFTTMLLRSVPVTRSALLPLNP